jgi:hypothetical protein
LPQGLEPGAGGILSRQGPLVKRLSKNPRILEDPD